MDSIGFCMIKPPPKMGYAFVKLFFFDPTLSLLYPKNGPWYNHIKYGLKYSFIVLTKKVLAFQSPHYCSPTASYVLVYPYNTDQIEYFTYIREEFKSWDLWHCT